LYQSFEFGCDTPISAHLPVKTEKIRQNRPQLDY